jgi:hypothetical protein
MFTACLCEKNPELMYLRETMEKFRKSYLPACGKEVENKNEKSSL